MKNNGDIFETAVAGMIAGAVLGAVVYGFRKLTNRDAKQNAKRDAMINQAIEDEKAASSKKP